MSLLQCSSSVVVRNGFLGVALALSAGCATVGVPPTMPSSRTSGRLSMVHRWLCYYGNDRGVLALPDYSLMILDADGIGGVSNQDKAGRLCLAYLSIGEAGTCRPYWKGIEGKPWVLHENPDWGGDHLVDPRSAEWRELVVKQEAPRLRALGYDGFFLDTLDTVDTLASHDAARYAGVEAAMAEIVAELRAAFPDSVMVANGGLSLMPRIARYLDGVAYEGCRATYDLQSKKYRDRTPQEIEWLDERLGGVRRLGLPVFALDYVDPKDARRAEAVTEALRRAGYRPFISVITLDAYPGEEKKP